MEGYIAKIIIPMLKNQTVNIKQYDFILNKLKPLGVQNITIASFLPLQKANDLFQSITPTFNKDQHFFTPAFLLPTQQKFYRQNASYQRCRFQERIQNAFEKKIVQNNFKFTPPSNYCQLCKLSFQNYHDHTQSQSHCKQITACPVNRYIEELAQKYERQSVKYHKTMKIKKNKQYQCSRKRKNCRVVDDNNNIKKSNPTDSKNSNQSTNLMSLSY